MWSATNLEGYHGSSYNDAEMSSSQLDIPDLWRQLEAYVSGQASASTWAGSSNELLHPQQDVSCPGLSVGDMGPEYYGPIEAQDGGFDQVRSCPCNLWR